MPVATGVTEGGDVCVLKVGCWEIEINFGNY